MKTKKLQNFIQKSDGYVTLHYVTHDKIPSSVTISVKNTNENRQITNTMLNQAKNQGIPRLK